MLITPMPLDAILQVFSLQHSMQPMQPTLQSDMYVGNAHVKSEMKSEYPIPDAAMHAAMISSK